MGSGKTTIGNKLARLLNYDFIDTDQEIEHLTNNTILQIFESKSELFFREQERKILLSCSEKEHVVVSTGGGLPCFFDNMRLMNETGHTIYLHASEKTLGKRLAQQQQRPLIKNIAKEALEIEIKNMLIQREPFYRQANTTINIINLTAQKLYQKLLEAENV
jgi:shikimate kinase